MTRIAWSIVNALAGAFSLTTIVLIVHAVTGGESRLDAASAIILVGCIACLATSTRSFWQNA